NAIDAQGAFLHHPVAVVVFAGAIGTCPRAQLAADASVGIDEDDAVVGPLVAGSRGTDSDAGRLLPIQARTGRVDPKGGSCLADLIAVHAIKPGAMRVLSIGIVVR